MAEMMRMSTSVMMRITTCAFGEKSLTTKSMTQWPFVRYSSPMPT